MAKIISDNALNDAIQGFGKTMEELIGFSIPPIDMPGLGSFMATSIRTVEMGLTTTFEPFLKLKEMVSDIPALPDKLAEFIENFKEISQDPPGFVVKLMIQPITENFAMPIPSPEAIIQILLGSKKISDIDFSDPKNVIETTPYSKLPQADKDQIAKIIPTAMPKLLSFLLLPAKIMIGFFVGFIKLIIDALNVTKLPDFVSEWVNPVKGILTMVGTIFGETIGGAIKDFFLEPIDDSIPVVTEFIVKIFTGSNPVTTFKEYSDNVPAFGPVKGFIGFFVGLIKWMLSFITEFPSLFLS